LVWLGTDGLLERITRRAKLAISVVAKVVKLEPAIVNVTVILIDGTTALLRPNAFEARSLLSQ
jgi:hypothetical protein